MEKFSLISRSETQTQTIGETIAHLLQKGDILCLFGQLGSGKTQLVKGLASGLGVLKNGVNSPSFVLLKQYRHAAKTLNHFDLFRLKSEQEILNIGFEEYVYSQSISVIEWADRLSSCLPDEFLGIELKVVSETSRRLAFFARGRRYQALLQRLKQARRGIISK